MKELNLTQGGDPSPCSEREEDHTNVRPSHVLPAIFKVNQLDVSASKGSDSNNSNNASLSNQRGQTNHSRTS